MQRRTIVHIDQDCFYAAIEMRERGIKREVPVAVGGGSRRGVLTTCNYKARSFGCRSAMPVFKALELCPQLLILPVNFDLYRAESKKIRTILQRYTDLIEPLSLDEAHLDVSHLDLSGWDIATEIRQTIRKELRLPSSAGIAPNKLLAKIASDWNKPNGQFEIKPEDVGAFMLELPVRRLHGVGPKMAQRLERKHIRTCGDLQQVSLAQLIRAYQSWGANLYQLCRGIDDRAVEPNRARKSCSTETTFRENVATVAELIKRLPALHEELIQDIKKQGNEDRIEGVFCKIKFADFTQTTVARSHVHPSLDIFATIVREGRRRNEQPVRLLGVGVRYGSLKSEYSQMKLDLGL